MKFRELVTITRPSPAVIDEFLPHVRELGYEVRSSSALALVLTRTFQENAFESLRARLVGVEAQAKVRRSIGPEFDEKELREAPLVVVDFPEEEALGLELEGKCRTCGDYRVGSLRRRRKKLSEARPKRLKGAAVRVNGHAVAVSRVLRDEMLAAGIRGGHFLEFGSRPTHFFIAPETDLINLRARPEEALAFRGLCSTCGKVLAEMYFGPLRYARDDWSGDDIVYSALEDDVLFSQAALDVIRRHEPEARPIAPVLFDEGR